MAEQEMLLDSATKAAVAGEKWATEKVIEHYAPHDRRVGRGRGYRSNVIMKLLEALPKFPMEQAKQKNSAGTQRPYSPAPGTVVHILRL